MSTYKFDVCHGVPYKTSDGEEKKRWTKIGGVFESDNGKLSMLLEYVPTASVDGKVWLSLIPPKPRE